MDIFWNHTLWNQACAAKKLDTLPSPGVKFIVCDNNYVNSLLFHYFYMFLLKQCHVNVMNPRMVLKLTCIIKCQYLHVALFGSGMFILYK